MLYLPEQEGKREGWVIDPKTTRWHKRFLRLADHISAWSKDPSTKVGAVIADRQNRIISLGFNGFPQGIKDTKERLENRETKYKIVVHGEINAIHFAKRDLENCILYTYPFQPCSRCAVQIIQTKIKLIVSLTSNIERWQEDFDFSLKLLEEANVNVILYSTLNEIPIVN